MSETTNVTKQFLDKDGLNVLWTNIRNNFAGKDELNKFLPLTGGNITGVLTAKSDIILKHNSSGDTPKLIFQRGNISSDSTNSDTYIDYDIYNTGGKLTLSSHDKDSEGNGRKSALITIGRDSSNYKFYTSFDTNIRPTNNNIYNLGTDKLKWANVYATTFTGELNGNAKTAKTLPHFKISSNGQLAKDPNDSSKYLPEYVKFATITIPTNAWARKSVTLFFQDYEATGYQGDILTIQASSNEDGVGNTPQVKWVTKYQKSTIGNIIISEVSDNVYDLYLEATTSYITLRVFYLTLDDVGADKTFNFINVTNSDWSTTVPNPITGRSTLSNIASAAAALSAAKTLWGQSFNGTANVSGDMTGVGSISMSKALILTGTTAETACIKFNRDGASTWNYIVWPGNTDTDCKLAFGYGTSSDKSYYYMTSDAFYPVSNNVKNLGSLSNKWKNVYATTFNGALNGNATTATKADKLGKFTQTRIISLEDNHGYPKLVLLADITDLWGKTEQSTKRYGFIGEIISSRSGGLVNDYKCDINIIIGYNGNLTTSTNTLSSTTSKHIPVIITYNNKTYIALKTTGSGRSIEFRGHFINCLEPFEKQEQLLYTDSNTLPAGVEILATGTVDIKSSVSESTNAQYYYPTFVSGTSTTTEYKNYVNNGFRVYTKNATSTGNGDVTLAIGSKATDTVKAQKGFLRIYGESSSALLWGPTGTAVDGYSVYLPSEAGTLVVKNDSGTANCNISGNAATATKSSTANETIETLYGVCTTAGDVTAKEVKLSSSTTLSSILTGTRVSIKFNNTHTVQGMTLNINELGAKDCLWCGSEIPANYIKGYNVYDFTYDGSGSKHYWRLVGGVDTNTTYSAATTSKAGLMSADDKTKLNGITAGADAVSFTPSLTTGTKIGTININSNPTDIYCEKNTDTKNTAGSTQTSDTIYFIGATSQGDNTVTYSKSSIYSPSNGSNEAAFCVNDSNNIYSGLYFESTYGDGHIYVGNTAGKDTIEMDGSDCKIYVRDSDGDTTIEMFGSTGKCYCVGGFYETSDERLKNFGDDIEVDLDKLSKLSKKYFTWKNDESNTQHIGVSAQEVQDIYPELVDVIDEEGHLSVSYDKLSVVALKGIDILNDKIKSLEERIERLEKLINV